MPNHIEKRFLEFTPKQLFDLVVDIEKYPEFLPWCAAARITKRNGNKLLADLVISFKAFTEKYTSDVTLTSPSTDNSYCEIDVNLVEGPFSKLVNNWKFYPYEGGTNIEFLIEFSFKSKLLNSLIGNLFDKALTKMIQAFEDRAKKLYNL